MNSDFNETYVKAFWPGTTRNIPGAPSILMRFDLGEAKVESSGIEYPLMEITLNGEAHTLRKTPVTIAEFVASLDIGEAPVLVELNGEAVLTREFEDREISHGDVVEVIRMVAGG